MMRLITQLDAALIATRAMNNPESDLRPNVNRMNPKERAITDPGIHHPTAETPLRKPSSRGKDIDCTHSATGRSPGKRSRRAALTDIATDAAISSKKGKVSERTKKRWEGTDGTSAKA